MAKYLLRNRARELRRKGISVKGIAEYLGVSKSTASIWVRDIILTVEQLEKLRNIMLRGSELGRTKGALVQKERRLKFIKESRNKGIAELSSISERELLIAGLALYWGEGGKKNQGVNLCNSDPKMIQFLLLWLKKCFEIMPNEIRCCVGINQMHRKREKVVRDYWSKISGIPISQFRKTSFKKVKNSKIYENFNEHYGTLSVIVTKPSRFYFKILGLIEGLYQAGSKYNCDFDFMPG